MIKINILNVETEEQLLSRLDKMAHICHSDNYEDRDFKKQLNLYKNLINKEHLSQVEHLVFYFTIEGITKSCAEQIRSHRITSPSQQSLSHIKNIEFFLPKRLENNQLINNALEQIKKIYKDLIKNGISHVDARFVLPICTGTKYSMTANLRSLINFFKLRKFNYINSEIREVGKILLDELGNKYPIIFGEIKNKFKL